MRTSLVNKWLIIAVVALLQLLLTVQAQIAAATPEIPEPSTVTTKSPVVVPPVTSTTVRVSATTTTTVAVSVPPVASVTTTLSTFAPPSSIVASSTIASSTVVSTTSSSTPITTTTTSTTPSSTIPSTSSTSSSIIASATVTSKADTSSKSNNNVPVIVGSVVGGVVGIALIGGILACINRRGGCTKKRDKKKSDFEDYGLGDFPHHRTPAVAPPVISNKPVSPTIPRMNDQGNYYNEDPNYGHYSYQDNNVDYGMQPQQGYYYPQQQQHQPQQEYYDDGGYYYDSNTSATAYSSVPPTQQHQSQVQQGYAMNNVPQQHNMAPQDVYKPDEVGTPVTSNANVVHHNR